MSRSSKCLLALLLSGALVIQVGCTFSGTGGKTQHKRILAPVKISYLVENQLDIIQSEDQNENYHESLVFISGLADKNVEDKINRRLRDLYTDVKTRELPPYRGIRVHIPANSVQIRSFLHAYVSFNNNNAISVVVNNHRTYTTPDGKGYIHPEHDKFHSSRDISLIDAVNIDLNTGDDITLKDVFVDNADYLGLLSDQVAKQIMKSTATDETYSYYDNVPLKLVAPFKGISAGQKYYLYQSGINLLLDHRNPEFDTGFHPTTLSVHFCDMGDNIAITGRFYDREASGVFTRNEPAVKQFLQTNHAQVQSREVQETAGGWVSVSYSYPRALPEHMVTLILNLSQEYKEVVEKLKSSPQGWGVEHNVIAETVGPYLSIRKSYYMYRQERWDSSSQYLTYDRDYRLVALQDLFVTGYVYSPIIDEALKQALLNYGLDTLRSEELMHDLQFNLGLSEVQFCTKPVRIDEHSVQTIYFQVLYKDFGCNNMTIFLKP